VTVIARRVRSVPVRLASETWEVICDMIAPRGTSARVELDAVANVAAMLISEQYTGSAPIIISGVGPQVRVYTLHGDDAIDAEDDGLPVHHQLDGEGWFVSLPARQPDVDVARGLINAAGRITVRDVDESDDAASRPTLAQGSATIDLEELSRL
jgi:hypothetical protein